MFGVDLTQRIAGAPVLWWIGFHAAVLVLLVTDALLPHSRRDEPRPKLAWMWSLFMALVAGEFAFWLNFEQGRQTALEFVSGYTIETSLSVDNLFVFLILFRGFGISHRWTFNLSFWVCVYATHETVSVTITIECVTVRASAFGIVAG